MIKYKTIKIEKGEKTRQKKLLAIISSFGLLKPSSSALEAKEIYFIILIIC